MQWYKSIGSEYTFNRMMLLSAVVEILNKNLNDSYALYFLKLFHSIINHEISIIENEILMVNDSLAIPSVLYTVFELNDEMMELLELTIMNNMDCQPFDVIENMYRSLPLSRPQRKQSIDTDIEMVTMKPEKICVIDLD